MDKWVCQSLDELAQIKSLSSGCFALRRKSRMSDISSKVTEGSVRGHWSDIRRQIRLARWLAGGRWKHCAGGGRGDYTAKVWPRVESRSRIALDAVLTQSYSRCRQWALTGGRLLPTGTELSCSSEHKPALTFQRRCTLVR
jgi:hypothetical protein